MRLDGERYQCDDGIVRPIIHGEILAGDGVTRRFPFLVDTGADRTVISADALKSLQVPHRSSGDQLGGIGGLAETVTISAELLLLRDDGNWAKFRGEYAACLNYEILDMSVLGRDILNLFALIVDRGADVVTLIRPAHAYSIHTQR